MKDLDLSTLRLFVAVCDVKSITRVGERENMVPSAITKRLAKLEQDFGTPLLKRIHRGVSPTEAGQTLLEHARGLLKGAAHVLEEMSYVNSGSTGLVQIISNASSVAGTLTHDLSQFLQHPKNKGIRVRLQEQASRYATHALREGSVSLGVLWDAVDLSGLETVPYHSDRMSVVVHRSHVLAKRLSLTLEECVEFDHIGVRSARLVQSILERNQHNMAFNLRFRAEVSTFDAAFRLVSDQLGIAIAPLETTRHLAHLYPLKVIPLSDAWAERRHVVCFRDKESLSPAAKVLLEHLARSATANIKPAALAA